VAGGVGADENAPVKEDRLHKERSNKDHVDPNI